jgi:hypothetical protein
MRHEPGGCHGISRSVLLRQEAGSRNNETALDAAQDPDSDAQGSVSRLIAKILDLGIDGRGPFLGAAQVAEKAHASKGSTAPEIRTAVLLTLIGNDAGNVLQKAGVPFTAATPGAVTSILMGRLPKSALMVVNKAVGFRILRSVGERTLVPIAGGVLGAALDGYLMRQLGKAARREFPQRPL